MLKLAQATIDYARQKREILLDLIETDLVKLPETVETCFAHGTQSVLALEIGHLALKQVFVGSMYARVNCDYKMADAHFCGVGRLLPFLASSLDRLSQEMPLHQPPGPDQIFEPLSLKWVMVGSLLASDQTQARVAAELVLHPRVRERAHPYPYERFLAATILQRHEQAAGLARDTDTPLFTSLNGLSQAILAADQAKFDEAISRRAEQYALGSRRRTYEEHGWTKNANMSTIDSFGIAYCRVAASLGLHINVNSPHYPPAYLVPWNEGTSPPTAA